MFMLIRLPYKLVKILRSVGSRSATRIGQPDGDVHSIAWPLPSTFRQLSRSHAFTSSTGAITSFISFHKIEAMYLEGMEISSVYRSSGT